MGRIFLAGLLTILTGVGCCTTSDALTTAAKGNTRDLRIIRSKMVPLLPEQEVEVGDKTWTLRGLWDNRMASFIVKARSIEAGLAEDKTFDTVQAAKEEGLTQEPR
jgi:hypothetical protein